MKPQLFQFKQNFTLEQGGELPSLNVVYHSYGKLNKQADNVIWVCHALTANSEVSEWWPGMVGKGKLLDPEKHFIVCANVIGSCYGTTGPTSTNPAKGVPWYREFPEVSIRDQVRAFELLRNHLGIKAIHTVMGGSTGGFQALEFSIMFPDLIKNLVFIASSVKTSPWATAFNQSQRLAIEADPGYAEDRPYGGSKGLKAARSIALLSYRNEQIYNQTQKVNNESKTRNLPAATYQDYQGDKLVRRFDAYSYHLLTRMMDSHNVIRERGSLAGAIERIKARVLCIGISSDRLFPVHEQKFLAHLTNGNYCEIESVYGHDGFLIESKKLSSLIRKFWQKEESEKAHSRNGSTSLKESKLVQLSFH